MAAHECARREAGSGTAGAPAARRRRRCGSSPTPACCTSGGTATAAGAESWKRGPGLSPAHPRTLQPFGDQRLARRFHHSAADRIAALRRPRVVHSLPMPTEVSQHCPNLAPPRMLAAQIAQPPDHSLHPAMLIAQHLTILLVLPPPLPVRLTVGAIKRRFQLLGGVEEVHQLTPALPARPDPAAAVRSAAFEQVRQRAQPAVRGAARGGAG